MAISAEGSSCSANSTPSPFLMPLPEAECLQRCHSSSSKPSKASSTGRRPRRRASSGTRARVEALVEDLASAALGFGVGSTPQPLPQIGAAPATRSVEGPYLPLGDVPADVLHRLLHMLPVKSILLLSQTSSRMSSLLSKDLEVWRELCQRDFGADTDPEAWLQPCQSRPLTRQQSSPSLFADYSRPPLLATSYRSLYQILHHNERLVGLWRGLGCGPEGALFVFRWAPSFLEGLQVSGPPGEPWAALRPFHTFGHRHADAVASFDDEGMCTVRELPPVLADGMPQVFCDKASAAALVAESSGVVMGSSPEGTWGYEVMLFMQGTVAPTRRKKKSPSRLLRDAPPVLHHLSRLKAPEATAAEPLSGLWEAHLQDGGVQVVCIEYLHRKRKPTSILATKVTGDGRVGCNKVLWEAKASVVAEPWDDSELQLIQGVSHTNAAANPGQEGGAAGVPGAPASAVLAVHSAECSSAQFDGGDGKCAGRLWRYEDGHLGICWILPASLQYVQFRRLDRLLASEQPG